MSTAREIPDASLDTVLAESLKEFTPERGALIIVLMADRPETVDLDAIVAAAEAGPSKVRLAALSALGRVGNESCLSTLLDSVLDSDEAIASAARESLGDLPGQNVNQEILSRLSTARGEMYQLLIEVVGQRRIAAVPDLVKALDHSETSVREAALTSLGQTVTPDSLHVLVTQSISPRIADDAATALVALKTASIRMPDREACAFELTEALERTSGPTKDSLLEIIAEVGGTTALQTVGAAASSDDPQMQDTGSRLLGRWSTVDAAPVLLDLAKNSSNNRYHVRAIRGYISLARRFATMPEPQRLEICQNTLDVARQVNDKKLVLQVLETLSHHQFTQTCRRSDANS